LAPQTDREHWRADNSIYREEGPQLLNPEIDQPEEHLAFTLEGKVQTIRTTDKCKNSERVVKLNRDDLVLARRTIIDHFFFQIKGQTSLILSHWEQGKHIDKETFQRDPELCYYDLFSRIEGSAQADKEFALLGRQLYTHFPYIFTSRLNGDLARRIVSEAFMLYKLDWKVSRLQAERDSGSQA